MGGALPRSTVKGGGALPALSDAYYMCPACPVRCQMSCVPDLTVPFQDPQPVHLVSTNWPNTGPAPATATTTLPIKNKTSDDPNWMDKAEEAAKNAEQAYKNKQHPHAK